jgi:DNA polymerase III subunit epsilon
MRSGHIEQSLDHRRGTIKLEYLSNSGTPELQTEPSAPISEYDLPAMAAALKTSGQYRVLKKYERPSHYSSDDGCDKVLGILLDTETTGFNRVKDKIIELSMVAFTFSKDGRIFELVDEFDAFEDPQMPIPEEITNLTGITNTQVSGERIDDAAVEAFLSDASLIIAHNSEFDRSFTEKRFSIFRKKPWACSLNEIPWKDEGLESSKLGFLAYRCGFFFDGHRAIEDCLATIHILAHRLPKSGSLVLKKLLENARRTSYKIWAIGAPYEKKDLLKESGYRWNNGDNGQPKAWYIEVFDDEAYREQEFLTREIYGADQSPRIDEVNAFNRYSSRI